ncbi:serine protein kinase RIO [Microbacterium nymphoidis]|uniref:serine protein kinase RIO n=1 Tax=Microbacterium nymphoidis TaxID=2898586 RepID=UPI001E56C686|nr:RIO1 family regulatory kinase/ATPase [Microbacterium nymphoidis]MCD2496766.1 serine/threonine protein kinase [Microbacterium nymphoidis]
MSFESFIDSASASTSQPAPAHPNPSSSPSFGGFDDDVLGGQAFDQREPGPGQRWSTWPSASPTERGPLPHPAWLVTSAAAFDTELGVVKTGKEADVHLIERAVPDREGCLLAAKRYRGTDTSDFHRSGQYEEGRRLRRSRDVRAVEKKSTYGRSVSAGHWAGSEFAALCAAYEAGIPVPYPVQVSGTEVLLEFIGDGREAAPRLAQTRLRGAELADPFEQVRALLIAFARAGLAHGDLSAYNLLLHRGRVVVIDLPQIVDLAANPAGADFLHRDVLNVCTWFQRRGVEVEAEEVFADVIAQLW